MKITQKCVIKTKIQLPMSTKYSHNYYYYYKIKKTNKFKIYVLETNENFKTAKIT